MFQFHHFIFGGLFRLCHSSTVNLQDDWKTGFEHVLTIVTGFHHISPKEKPSLVLAEAQFLVDTNPRGQTLVDSCSLNTVNHHRYMGCVWTVARPGKVGEEPTIPLGFLVTDTKVRLAVKNVLWLSLKCGQVTWDNSNLLGGNVWKLCSEWNFQFLQGGAQAHQGFNSDGSEPAPQGPYYTGAGSWASLATLKGAPQVVLPLLLFRLKTRCELVPYLWAWNRINVSPSSSKCFIERRSWCYL